MGPDSDSDPAHTGAAACDDGLACNILIRSRTRRQEPNDVSDRGNYVLRRLGSVDQVCWTTDSRHYLLHIYLPFSLSNNLPPRHNTIRLQASNLEP